MSDHILLINPWIHDFSAYDLWIKPLGLLYIGSFLEKHKYKTHLIDCLDSRQKNDNFGCGHFTRQIISRPSVFKNIPRKYKRYGIAPDELLKNLLDFKSKGTPLFVAVTSMMTYWYEGVLETIKYVKKVFPGVPVVLGGVYATLCYEHANKYSGADYVIRGRGEKGILKIAENLSGRRIVNRQNNKFGSLPYPAYHLYSKLDHVAMLSSRGCPFNCSYCASSLLYDGFYQRPATEVFKEIEYYSNKFKIKDIAFYDDALLVNADNHIKLLLDLIIKNKINEKINFHLPNGLHVKYITPDIANMMYKANFKTIRLGFESSQLRWQENSSYKTSNEDFKQAIENLKNAGYSNRDIGVYVIMGLPGQTLDEINETIDFVFKTGAKVKLAQYAPIPNTPDFNKAVREYNLNPDEPLLHNKSVYPLKPSGISFQEMEDIKSKVKKQQLALKNP